MITFFVPGIPKSTQTGSVIRVKGRAFPIRRNTAWSQIVGLVARQYAPTTPYQGAMKVTLHFLFPQPKSSRRAYPTVRPDLDNAIKGLLDSLNGVLWKDDAQVVTLIVRKRYDERPGLEISVAELA